MKSLRFTLAAFLCLQSTAFSTIDVFLNFGATFESSLDSMTTDAGVTNFSASEKAAIRSNIQTQLQSIYSDFTINFLTTDPGTPRHTVNFNATTANNNLFGSAPGDAHNAFDDQTASVFTRNFHNAAGSLQVIEAGDARAQIIDEVSTALAGTAAHEFGHSLGLHHHHAYDAAGINPSTYANTGGLQNQNIMATGSTGLTETGRDSTDRTLSDFSKLHIETAGALAPLGGSASSAVATPLALQQELGPDVGGTPASATVASLVMSSVLASNHLAGFVISTLASDADIDVFSFTVNAPTELTAEVRSETNVFADDFDPILRLIGTDMSTVLASNNNVVYNGNTFGSGTFGFLDSFLVNISLPTAGTYYLEVSSFGNIGGNPGGVYTLLFDADVAAVPEPASLAMMLTAGGLCCLRIRRRRQGGNSDDC